MKSVQGSTNSNTFFIYSRNIAFITILALGILASVYGVNGNSITDFYPIAAYFIIPLSLSIILKLISDQSCKKKSKSGIPIRIIFSLSQLLNAPMRVADVIAEVREEVNKKFKKPLDSLLDDNDISPKAKKSWDNHVARSQKMILKALEAVVKKDHVWVLSPGALEPLEQIQMACEDVSLLGHSSVIAKKPEGFHLFPCNLLQAMYEDIYSIFEAGLSFDDCYDEIITYFKQDDIFLVDDELIPTNRPHFIVSSLITSELHIISDHIDLLFEKLYNQTTRFCNREDIYHKIYSLMIAFLVKRVEVGGIIYFADTTQSTTNKIHSPPWFLTPNLENLFKSYPVTILHQDSWCWRKPDQGERYYIIEGYILQKKPILPI